MKNLAYKYALVAIIILSAILRLYNITTNPPGLNWDEVSIGYNAYSILETGKDEWGRHFPLAFEAYGEYKLPLYIYASIPSIAIFGLSDFAVRLTPAIIGILSVYCLYLFIRSMLGQNYALAGALLLALSPWHIHLTRAAFEASLAFLLILMSMFCLHKSRGQPSMLCYTAVFAALSMYAYNSARLVVPIFATLFLALNLKWLRENLKFVIISSAIFIALTLPATNSLPTQLVRWNTLDITNDMTFRHEIGLSRIYTRFPESSEKFLHNKYTHLVHRIYLNYLDLFSSNFLFLEGDAHTQRSVQGMGLLYLFELPLFIFGIKKLSKLSRFDSKIVLSLLAVAPFPSTITIDGPSALRALNLLIPITIINAIGLVEILNINWSEVNRHLRFVVVLFIIWNIVYFLYLEFWVYPVKYATDWQYGYKEGITRSLLNYDKADRIFITTKHGEPYMYTLFYGKVDPQYFQNTDVKRTRDETGWVHVDSFGKFYFIDFLSEINHPVNLIKAYSDEHIIMLGGYTDIRDVEVDWTITSPNSHIMFEKAEHIPDESNN